VACDRPWNGIALAVETAGVSTFVTAVGTAADAGVVTVLEVCNNLEAGCATDTGAVVALECNRSRSRLCSRCCVNYCWADPDVETAGVSTLVATASSVTDTGIVAAPECNKSRKRCRSSSKDNKVFNFVNDSGYCN
jgi:hypothetical protein